MRHCLNRFRERNQPAMLLIQVYRFLFQNLKDSHQCLVRLKATQACGRLLWAALFHGSGIMKPKPHSRLFNCDRFDSNDRDPRFVSVPVY